jgi:ribosomal-protein-alanine N-acetyltransferase
MSTETPVLETERLRLEIPGPEHAKAMAAYLSENRDHLEPWSPPQPDAIYTVPFWETRLASFVDDFHAERAARFVLVPRDEPVVIAGAINYSQIFRGAFQACYLGYGIGKRFEGRGLMYEALVATNAFVFETLRLHRIMANYVPTNERSAALLRRLGFAVEGYARDYLFIDGAWRDHVLTSLTNARLERP